MRLIFMGTPDVAVPTLRRCVEDGHEVVAVWTQPDRPAGRGNKLKASPVKEYAVARGIPVHQPIKVKTDEACALFASYEADAAVVVAYGRILPSAFLRAPRLGCVNVHFSLLPKYRGAAPVNWAIARGETASGVTTMLIDEGLDTGDILLQRATPIGEGEAAPELLARLALSGAELLSETLARFDEIEPRPQQHEDATLAPILRREDGLIDWTLDATEIARRVRGFQPWPAAHTTYDGRRLVIWRARVILEESPSDEAMSQETPQHVAVGSIIRVRGEELVVKCGNETILCLDELQIEGKQRMGARDFINGMHVSVGAQLG